MTKDEVAEVKAVTKEEIEKYIDDIDKALRKSLTIHALSMIPDELNIEETVILTNFICDEMLIQLGNRALENRAKQGLMEESNETECKNTMG